MPLESRNLLITPHISRNLHTTVKIYMSAWYKPTSFHLSSKHCRWKSIWNPGAGFKAGFWLLWQV